LTNPASPLIVGNVITKNTGSGILCSGDAAPVIKNNIIVENLGDWGGCGIYCAGSTARAIADNTIVGNPGGGIRAWGSQATVVNCIIWGNGEDLGGVEARHCCIQDANEGEGNISTYPHFVDQAGGDFYLKSKFGRWNPAVGKCVRDEVTSPCAGAGDPASRFPRPDGERVNVGAYGNTEQASRSREFRIGSPKFKLRGRKSEVRGPRSEAVLGAATWSG